MNCGIVEEMETVFMDTINLQIKKDINSIIVSGPRDTVRDVLRSITRNIKVRNE